MSETKRAISQKLLNQTPTWRHHTLSQRGTGRKESGFHQATVTTQTPQISQREREKSKILDNQWNSNCDNFHKTTQNNGITIFLPYLHGNRFKFTVDDSEQTFYISDDESMGAIDGDLTKSLEDSTTDMKILQWKILGLIKLYSLLRNIQRESQSQPKKFNAFYLYYVEGENRGSTILSKKIHHSSQIVNSKKIYSIYTAHVRGEFNLSDLFSTVSHEIVIVCGNPMYIASSLQHTFTCIYVPTIM